MRTTKKWKVEPTKPNKNTSPNTNRKGRENDNTRSHKRYKKKPIERANPFGRWTKPTAPRAEIQRSGQTHDLAQRHQNTLPP